MYVKKVFNCKACINIKNYSFLFKTLANFVPAAAVKREGLALFELIGRKEYVGWKLINWVKIKNNFIELY